MGALDDEFGSAVNAPVELFVGHELVIDDGGGIGAVDDVGLVVFDDKFDHVDVVLVGAGVGAGVLGEFGQDGRIIVGDLWVVTAVFLIILQRQHLFLADH